MNRLFLSLLALVISMLTWANPTPNDKYPNSTNEDNTTTTSPTAEKQPTAQKTLKFKVDDYFLDYSLLNHDCSKVLLSKETTVSSVTSVKFTDEDLPLVVSARLMYRGKVQAIRVCLDDEILTPTWKNGDSSTYEGLMVEDGQTITLSLITHSFSVIVNEPSSIGAFIQSMGEYGYECELFPDVFKDCYFETSDIGLIDIWGANGFHIISVKINGQDEVKPMDNGEYRIGISQAVDFIEVIVEKIISCTVNIKGLNRFKTLSFMNHDGENGKILVDKSSLKEGQNDIEFSSMELPVQLKGEWNNANYKMVMTLDDKLIEPSETSSTSSLYGDLNLDNGQQMFIALWSDVEIKTIEKLASKDSETLEAIKNDLDAARKEYAAYIDRDKVTVYNELSTTIDQWRSKLIEAYNTALITGQYTTPWTAGELSSLKQKVSLFIQSLKDAKDKQNAQLIEVINRAANADRNALNAVQSQWESVVAQTSKDYPAYVSAFINDKNKIDSRLAKVSADIDAAQKEAIDNLSTYKSPSVAASLSEINLLITKYQNDIKAAYDKAQQEAEKAANIDRQVLQAMTSELEKASTDYSAYVNRNKYNTLVKAIDDLGKKVTEAYNTAVSSDNKYTTPWTTAEINALQKEIDEFIQGLKDAKEADTNKQIVEEITKAANADREAVQKLLTEWEKVLADFAKKYPGFTIAFDKANIDAKFSKVSADIDAAQKKAVDELSTYKSPSVTASLNEIKGLIDKYKADVEEAVNKIKSAAETAAENDRKAVKSAREASQSVIDATDRKYPAFVITGDKNSIYSSYDRLSSDIDNAYNKAVETLSTYVSPSVSETLAEIDAMVSQYQRDVAAAAEKAKEDASKEAASDKATLTELTNQVDQINTKYAPLGCIDTQKMNLIKTTIQTLVGKVDTALSEIFTTGSYQTPWTSDELQKIKDDISALEADCNSRLNTAIDTASKADLDKVDNLKKEYDKMIGTLHSQYTAFCDGAQEKAIADMFTTITNKINEAASKAKAETKLYVSPDVDNYLEKTINAKMEEYRTEVLEKAYETMSGADKAATKDRETLKGFKTSLEKAATDYAKYVDQAEYESLNTTIEDWSKKVDQAYDNVAQTGEYSSPWTQSEIAALQKKVEDFITGLRNAKDFEENTIRAINEAAEADRQALRDAQEAWETALYETNSKYPAFASSSAKKAIDDKFTSVSSDIDQAKTNALDSMKDYESPSINSALEEIEAMVAKYQQDVEAAANKALEEANQFAERDRNELAQLTGQLNELNSAYAPIECMDTKTFNSIAESIDDLNGLIEPELNAVFTKGAYQTPWTAEEIQYIRQSIRNLEGVCNRKLQNLVDEGANSDRSKVNTLREDFLVVLENPHRFFANHCDPAKEKEINDKLDEVSNKITLAASDAMASIQLYESPDVDTSLDGILEEMSAYKQSIIDRLVAPQAETLQGMESKLQDIYKSYKDILDMEVYESLSNALNELFDRLQETGEEAAFVTGVYETPWDEDETYTLNQAIINLDNDCYYEHLDYVDEVSNEDRIKVNTVKDEFKVLCEYLHSEYPDAYNMVMENEIATKLEDLLTRINQEASDAQNNKHPYNSPNVDQTLEEIRNYIDAYENYVRGSVLSDEEIDRLAALDTLVLEELESRLEDIFNTYQDYLDMDEYESISEALSELFIRLEEAQEEAYDSHKYSTPWEEEEIDDLRTRMDELEKNAQEAGISNVEADEQEAIYYDLNGRRILNPAPGKLYIRILGGKSQKVVI